MAKVIMIQGTMSNAGKSLLVTGLCRILKQDGFKVAPFKSQNMALNSYITKDGLEMGRAQVAQAYACGVEPDVRMNPILLKPTTDMGSQVIVNGEVQGNMRAMDYFKKKKEYIPAIMDAFHGLEKEFDIIVIEGAGSPAEINLKQDDIVNMGLAKLVDAPVLLVGDIDRGGVFAQLLGTLMLLEPEEQERIKGLIINKFRGDLKILEPGLDMLYERGGKKVLGVVPYADVDIEEEDSLADELSQKNITGQIDIAVIRLPKISNFTDFQALSIEKDISVRYVEKVSELGNPDVVILPGTKNTIKDLQWLRQSGLEGRILRLFEKGTFVFGICGGYQMLGKEIVDEEGIENEGSENSVKGIGLLPVRTFFETEKARSRSDGYICDLGGKMRSLSGRKVSGYEIHMGRSELVGDEGTFFSVLNGRKEGCVHQNAAGTYLHGIFDEEDFREAFLNMIYAEKGIQRTDTAAITYEQYREMQYDKLADILRKSLDMEKIYDIIGIRDCDALN
jgi:adenosylcobyric acid synthase